MPGSGLDLDRDHRAASADGGALIVPAVQTAAAESREAESTRSAKVLKPREILLLAVWFGLVTGYAELSSVLGVTYVLDRFLSFWGWHRLWMTPLADVLLFLLPGLVLAAFAWLQPRRASLRIIVTLFAFLGALSLAIYFDRKVHRAAILVFSAGFGVQAGRIALKHHLRCRGLVRATLPVMVALVLSLGLGLVVWQRFSERRALSGLVAAEGRPNVLLLILDTVRAMNLGLYGYDRATTPNLERFAERGVTFDWAMSAAPWTLPSHAAMFTGRYPFETKAYFRTALDETYPTLAEAMRARGYATAGFMANTEYAGRATGLARGFIRYEDYVPSPGHLMSSSSIVRMLGWSRTLRKVLGYYELFGRRYAADINAAFLEWQSETPGHPFFAVLNYFDAHAPYLPPEPYDTLFGGRRERHYVVQQERYVMTKSPELQEHIPSELAAYDASIAALDEHLGRLFTELERRGLLDNTVVIVTSDHGEEFGEHGIMGHAYNLNTTLLHVPLIVVAPNRAPAGARVSDPANLRDLPATILDLVGPGPGGFPGQSLARFWDVVPDLDEVVVSSEADMVSLISGAYHYIRMPDGKEQLFDYQADVTEQDDLFDSDAGRRFRSFFQTSLPSFYAEKRPWTVH
jgi:arylsulfatase A-like enzyme